jgi:hypothetical protein
MRRSTTCATAATTSDSLSGKWCSIAPRETPARSVTTTVVVRA